MWVVRSRLVGRAARLAAAVEPWGSHRVCWDSLRAPDDGERDWTVAAARDGVREVAYEVAVAVRDWKGLGLVKFETCEGGDGEGTRAMRSDCSDRISLDSLAMERGRGWGGRGEGGLYGVDAGRDVLRGLKARDSRFESLARVYGEEEGDAAGRHGEEEAASEGARPVREVGEGGLVWRRATDEAISAWMRPHREAVDEMRGRLVYGASTGMGRLPEWFPLGVQVSQERELAHPIWAPDFPIAGQYPLGPVRIWEEWDEEYEFWLLGCSRGWELGVAFQKLDEAIAYCAQYLETVQGMSLYHHPAYYPRVWAEEMTEDEDDEVEGESEDVEGEEGAEDMEEDMTRAVPKEWAEVEDIEQMLEAEARETREALAKGMSGEDMRKALRREGVTELDMMGENEPEEVDDDRTDFGDSVAEGEDDIEEKARELGGVTRGEQPTRRFVVASFAQFWHRYKHLFPEDRTCHEMILDGQRCHLYLDVEFPRGVDEPENELLDGNAAVKTVLNYVHEAFRDIDDFADVRISSVAQLDGSTPDKFSRHLIIHCLDQEDKEVVFSNNTHAGRLVRKAVNRMQEDAERGDWGLGPLPAKNMFFEPENSIRMVGRPMIREKGYSFSQCIVDMGVYAKNRTLRLVGSIKPSTRVPLRFVRSPEVEKIVDDRRIAEEMRELHAPPEIMNELGIDLDNIDPAKTSNKSLYEGSYGVWAAEAEDRHGILERCVLEDTLVVSLNRRDRTLEVQEETPDVNLEKLKREIALAEKRAASRDSSHYDEWRADLMKRAEGTQFTDKDKRDGEGTGGEEDGNDRAGRGGVAAAAQSLGEENKELERKKREERRREKQLLAEAMREEMEEAEAGNRREVYRKSLEVLQEEEEEAQFEEEFDDEDEDQADRESGVEFDMSEDLLELPHVVAHEGVRTDALNAMPEELDLISDYVLQIADAVAGKVEGTTSIRQCSLDPEGRNALFVLKDNRWCGNVKREHYSNNVYYVVDFAKATLVQKCTDPGCKGYSSRVVEIPRDMLPSAIHLEPAEDVQDAKLEFQEVGSAFDAFKPFEKEMAARLPKREDTDDDDIDDEIAAEMEDKAKVERLASEITEFPDVKIDAGALAEALKKVQQEEHGDDVEHEDDFDGEELEVQNQMWQSRTQTVPFDYSGLSEEEAAEKRAWFEKAAVKREKMFAKIFLREDKITPSVVKDLMAQYGLDHGLDDEVLGDDDPFSKLDEIQSKVKVDEILRERDADRERSSQQSHRKQSEHKKADRLSKEAIEEQWKAYKARMAKLFADGTEAAKMPEQEQAAKRAEEFVREFKDLFLWQPYKHDNHDGFYDDDPLEDEIRDFKKLWDEFVVPMPEILAELRQAVLEKKRELAEKKAAGNPDDTWDPFDHDDIDAWPLPDAEEMWKKAQNAHSHGPGSEHVDGLDPEDLGEYAELGVLTRTPRAKMRTPDAEQQDDGTDPNDA